MKNHRYGYHQQQESSKKLTEHSHKQEPMMNVFDIECDSLTPTLVHCGVCAQVSTPLQLEAEIDQLQPTMQIESFRPQQLDQLVTQLQNATTLVGHNIIAYDLPALWKIKGKWDTVPLILDTLIISRTLWPERPWGHSLEGWGEYLGEKKGDFSDFEEYSEEMLEYCEQDVIVTVKVLHALNKEYGEMKDGATLKGYSVYR
jgi:hypothetical protein